MYLRYITMTQAEILQSCQWDDLDFATLTVDSALLGQPVTVRLRRWPLENAT